MFIDLLQYLTAIYPLITIPSPVVHEKARHAKHSSPQQPQRPLVRQDFALSPPEEAYRIRNGLAKFTNEIGVGFARDVGLLSRSLGTGMTRPVFPKVDVFQKRVHKQRAVGLMFLHPLFSFPSVVDRQLLHSQTTDLSLTPPP